MHKVLLLSFPGLASSCALVPRDGTACCPGAFVIRLARCVPQEGCE